MNKPGVPSDAPIRRQCSSGRLIAVMCRRSDATRIPNSRFKSCVIDRSSCQWSIPGRRPSRYVEAGEAVHVIGHWRRRWIPARSLFPIDQAFTLHPGKHRSNRLPSTSELKAQRPFRRQSLERVVREARFDPAPHGDVDVSIVRGHRFPSCRATPERPRHGNGRRGESSRLNLGARRPTCLPRPLPPRMSAHRCR